MSFSSAIDGVLGTQIGSMFVGRGELPVSGASRDQYRREQRLNAARRSQWEKFEQKDLEFGKRWVVHRPTGRRFIVSRGELIDALYTGVTAYTLTEDGRDVIALEQLR